MKDRIEVNGVWYIKEDTIVQPTISQLEPGIKYDGFIFESNLYAFDCTRIYDEDGNLYKDGNVCIKFTDKRIIMFKLTEKQINDIAFNDKMLKNAKYFEKLERDEEKEHKKYVEEFRVEQIESKPFPFDYYQRGRKSMVIDQEENTLA